MTIKFTDAHIICDAPSCGRIQDIPARDRPEAVDLARKLGWWVGTTALLGAPAAPDYCPDHVAVMQAAGQLGPRKQD